VSTAADAPLFNRPDTMLGICEGIGREFGFHPNFLRIALAVPLVWNPLFAVGIYLALGVALLISRLVMPARNTARAEQPAMRVEGQEELALAA
jgi:phage shock protein PspC (stress-responsive transcriptional regulator)